MHESTKFNFAAFSLYVMEVMVQKSNAAPTLTLKNLFTPEPSLSRNHLFMPQRLFSIRISTEPRVSQSIYKKKMVAIKIFES